MHWLARELEGVRGLAARFFQLKAEAAADPLVRQARSDFHQGLHALVDQVAERRGVTASFASHEGLVVAAAGTRTAGEEEAWAAMAQLSLAYSQRTAQSLSLGELDQLVLVGRRGKLVLFPLEQVVLGVLSPVDVALRDALSI